MAEDCCASNKDLNLKQKDINRAKEAVRQASGPAQPKRSAKCCCG